MLIVAMPKSASTSFVETLTSMTGKKASLVNQGFIYDIDCEGYLELQKCHSNMKERPALFIRQAMRGVKTIFREHTIPTKRHIKIISQFKDPMIVLLRNPNHVYDSYDRMFKENNNTSINRDKLKKDIERFYVGWNKIKQDNILTIYYSDLVLNYNETMEKALKHLDIKAKIKPLLKKKYTGVGVERLC